MIKIGLALEGYLKNKFLTKIIEVNYSSPVKISKILEDAKISSADVFFIKIEDSLVKENYVIRKSCKIKLFPIIGGG